VLGNQNKKMTSAQIGAVMKKNALRAFSSTAVRGARGFWAGLGGVSGALDGACFASDSPSAVYMCASVDTTGENGQECPEQWAQASVAPFCMTLSEKRSFLALTLMPGAAAPSMGAGLGVVSPSSDGDRKDRSDRSDGADSALIDDTEFMPKLIRLLWRRL